MRTKTMLTIIVIILTISLNASVRINGLGSYFEYLIPDTETDIELFPSHLSEFESMYVQIINDGYNKSYDYFSSKNINFSIMPFSSRLSYKINLDIASNDDEPRIYLYDNYSRYSTSFDGSEFGSVLASNTLSYEFADSFHLGCFINYGVNWKEIGNERIYLEDPNVTFFENSMDFEYENDYVATGINFSLIYDYNIDISLTYSESDFDDYAIYEESSEYQDLGNEISTIRSDRILDNVDTESEDFGFAALFENSNDNILNRYLLEIHYIEQLTDYTYDRSSQRTRFEDGELEYDTEQTLNTNKSEQMKKYYIETGLGKTISREQLNIHYGIKIHGMLGDTDRNESNYSLEYYQNVDQDTTYTDSISVSEENNFEIKDWKVVIEVPFGMSYILNDNICINGGLGLKLIRQELEYFEENEFSRRETDRYVSLGSTISPFECMKCDINFGRDFAGFSSWQIDLKYLW